MNSWFPGQKAHVIPVIKYEPVKYDYYQRASVHLSFTLREERKGRDGLSSMGIPADREFVCFHQRDAEYLKSHLPCTDYSYHGYRDCRIANYITTCRELVRRGYYVLRMGVKVGDALPVADPGIIDYASKYRSNFMDIYLSAKCKFFVGCGSGIDEVPMIFRRPVMYVNQIPLSIMSGQAVVRLFIPKKLWLKKDKRFLTFKEILNSPIGNFYEAKVYEENGIEVIENSPEEITKAVIEMDEGLKGTWKIDSEEEEVQGIFASIIKSSPIGNQRFAKISTEFLRMNKYLLN